MAVRNALRRSALLTVAAILAGLWLLRTALVVWADIELASAGALGQGAFSGVVGLAVMVIALALLLVFAGELGESEPRPETWPPGE